MLNRLICWLDSHDYEVKRHVTDTVRELTCKRCKAEFGMNDVQGVTVSLTPRLKAAYDRMLRWRREMETLPLD